MPESKSPSLRSVVPNDEPFLEQVFASTRTEELSQVPWSESEKAQFLTSQFHAQRADYARRFPEAAHSIVMVEGEAVGRIWINRQDDEIRLLDIALLPDFRNIGLGTILLRGLQKEALASKLPLRHSVYKTNIAALRFYRRLGFEVIDDFETYVLMEWLGAELS
jgi:ribosomal protein S18 acetylase RimI-like enzyme